MKPAPITFDTFEYESSVDGTKPLYADAAFIADGSAKPLLVVMHGYGGTRGAVSLDLRELAPRGVFALAPDMRGRGGSAGRWDSGGLDVHDIIDAVRSALVKYPCEIDPGNLNIVGYSGGGGNAISCAVRFPDLFATVVSFFGISDYGGWHRSGGRRDCNGWMEAALGGTPDQLPEIFEARNAIPAAGNARSSRMHFFWDEEETMCPPAMIEQWLAEYRSRGLRNATTHVSRKGDAKRWIHNYRTGNPDLSSSDGIFLPDVLAPKPTPPMLARHGTLVVPGYLVTKHFKVWIGDGQRGCVTVEYDLGGAATGTGVDGSGAVDVRVVDNPRNLEVRIVRRGLAGLA